MNKAYPLEALLRPPIELWSSLCAFGMAIIAVLAPWSLMMTLTVGYGTAALLIIFGIFRSLDAMYILRYQRNIRKMPAYTLTANEIPVSQHQQF